MAALEKALARDPDDYALQKDLRSISRLAERFEQQFLELAKQSQIDVCRYRIIPGTNNYSLRNVTESLSDFQGIITAIYDAKVTGTKKTRASYSNETHAQSALQFGYTYGGSLGVVLMLESERDMFSGKFDDVVETFQQVLEVSDEHDVRDISRVLGQAVMGRVYQWAAANSAADYSLDIQWKRSDGVEIGEYIEAQKLKKIMDIILLTKEPSSEPIEVSGILVGIDVKKKAGSFHLVVPEGESFAGVLSDSFDRAAHWEVNTRYTARMTKRTVVHFATERTDVSFLLEGLEAELYS